jgi:cytoskeletal protein RodZ
LKFNYNSGGNDILRNGGVEVEVLSTTAAVLTLDHVTYAEYFGNEHDFKGYLKYGPSYRLSTASFSFIPQKEGESSRSYIVVIIVVVVVVVVVLLAVAVVLAIVIYQRKKKKASQSNNYIVDKSESKIQAIEEMEEIVCV